MSDGMSLTEYVRSRQPGPFRPGVPIFSELGRFVSVFWENEDGWADRINDVVVYRSFKTGKVVGVKVYGVQAAEGK